MQTYTFSVSFTLSPFASFFFVKIFYCIGFTLSIAQVVVLSWVYGIDRTFDNLSQMNVRLTGIVRAYWWCVLMFVTPIASFVST